MKGTFLLPEKIIDSPIDAEGNRLQEGDRIYSHDIKEGVGYVRCYATLTKSDHPETKGHWCADYDDGESFIILSWADVFKA